MPSSVENKTLIGFGSALVVLLAISVTAYLSITRLNAAMGRVAHTHVVIETLESTLAELTAAESAARGYALARDERLRLDYRAAAAQLEPVAGTIRTLTADNRRQQERLDALDPMIAARLALSENLIAT